jgi:glutamine transport system ATP-binding protein
MIQLNNISKSFNGSRVLNDISLLVRPKELVGVIGASGSGKTTLLRCINGLVPIDEGRVEVDGLMLSPHTPVHSEDVVLVRRRVGMVFQHLNLWPYKRALDNILEGMLAVRKLSRKDAIREAMIWAERLQITDQLHKYPGALSGGQRQRVALARALVMAPQFLLFDEITSALDPVLAGEIVDIMTELKAQGIGIVFVTHQIDFIRRSADMLYFLHNGQVKESGVPKETLAKPASPELETFIESIRHGW